MRSRFLDVCLAATLCLAWGCAGTNPQHRKLSANTPAATETAATQVAATVARGKQVPATGESRQFPPRRPLEGKPADDATTTKQAKPTTSITPVSSPQGQRQAAAESMDAPPPATDQPTKIDAGHEHTIQLNLPTALSMIAGTHPMVGLTQWRVQEAYAQLQQARVLWLPSIQSGFSFHRHDGNYQASDGSVVDVNRNSFQYGLGTGATGAGTTPRPGLIAEFHMADAIFLPKVAARNAWASGHAARGAKHDQLLAAAVGYLELLEAWQAVRIIEEALQHSDQLQKITSDYAESGAGLQADADRMRTEVSLVEDRLYTARERIEIASAGLAEALSIPWGHVIEPLDLTAAPIEMTPPTNDRYQLITTALSCRPELKASQALVAAACEQYRRQKNAPFVPSLLLGYSTGGFGGGLGNRLDDIDSRFDFDAVVTWQVRNLGHGEQAARRAAQARVQQAKYQKIQMLDQVVREVSAAHAQVNHRLERIAITRGAIEAAADSYRRNLSRIRDGQGLPLEVLQSIRALEDAQQAHLRAVTQYNQAQFQLHWSIGCPIRRPPQPNSREIPLVP